MVHRPQLVHTLSHSHDTDAAQRHRRHSRDERLRELSVFSVLNEPVSVPPRNHPLQDESPKNRVGRGFCPDPRNQGGGEVSSPTSDVQDELVKNSLPKLSIFEKVPEKVGFDAGPLIFAFGNLVLATTRVTPADPVCQGLGVHPMDVSVEDLGSMCGSIITFSWRVEQAVWKNFEILQMVCLCTEKGVWFVLTRTCMMSL